MEHLPLPPLKLFLHIYVNLLLCWQKKKKKVLGEAAQPHSMNHHPTANNQQLAFRSINQLSRHVTAIKQEMIVSSG